MQIFRDILISYCWLAFVNAYSNQLFTIAKLEEGKTREYSCAVYEGVKLPQENQGDNKGYLRETSALPTQTTPDPSQTTVEENPYEVYQDYLHKFLYGENIETDETTSSNMKLLHPKENNRKNFRHYVLGNYMRSELFNNRSGVHLPLMEFLHRGYCELKITRDYMQTAVNAFAIFLYGTLADIERLPADYVLRSTRTISMMKIAREKLVATWNVVKAGRNTVDIPHRTLELYRPLFKYINGREMARLNLSDERILNYVGTHPDLDRHQVGVVASKYIEINKDWSNPRYLNTMNNLLCGVPMNFMRRLPINTYLQLSHQVFYHIRACDPLQRRFYLAMMTRTKALGKSFSWTAGDVSRLGLLLTEVEGTDLSTINPEAMAGITAYVMMHMSPQKLQYLTDNQLKYLAPKPLNILGRKLKIYNEQLQLYDAGFKSNYNNMVLCILNSLLLLY